MYKAAMFIMLFLYLAYIILSLDRYGKLAQIINEQAEKNNQRVEKNIEKLRKNNEHRKR
jgi:formylmethanofuran dehydrogenase subunit E